MKHLKLRLVTSLLLSGIPCFAFAGLEQGEQINLTIRGVDPAEQQKISGIYRIGESGAVWLPLLNDLLAARGLTPEQFARLMEAR